MAAASPRYTDESVGLRSDTTSTESRSDSVSKLYDLGLRACRLGNRSQLRVVLSDLLTTFDGPARVDSRQAVHEFCLHQSALGDLDTVGDLLMGLREAWDHEARTPQPG